MGDQAATANLGNEDREGRRGQKDGDECPWTREVELGRQSGWRWVSGGLGPRAGGEGEDAAGGEEEDADAAREGDGSGGHLLAGQREKGMERRG